MGHYSGGNTTGRSYCHCWIAASAIATWCSTNRIHDSASLTLQSCGESCASRRSSCRPLRIWRYMRLRTCNHRRCLTQFTHEAWYLSRGGSSCGPPRHSPWHTARAWVSLGNDSGQNCCATTAQRRVSGQAWMLHYWHIPGPSHLRCFKKRMLSSWHIPGPSHLRRLMARSS